MTAQKVSSEGTVRVENVGGIDETEVSLRRGVNVLEGRNATNRTSFLQAVMAGLGSDRASLKADADEGYVALSLDDETYTRTLTRRDGRVVTGGDPYVDDPELADLFALLLESNEARRAVARGDDLRELIMRPIDVDEIQAEIRRLQTEKQSIDDELDALEQKRRRLPELERRRTELEDQLEAKREALAEKEAEIESLNGPTGEAEGSVMEETLEELRETRFELEDVRFELDTERESLDSLREERADLAAELDDLADEPTDDVAEIEAEIERLRAKREAIESDVNELQNVIQFNEEMLSEGGSAVLTDLEGDEGGGNAEGEGDPTDRLVEDASVTCWTCGTTVDPDRVEETLDRLRELSTYKLDESDDLQDRIEELVEERDAYREQRDRRERLREKLDRTDDEIARREDRIERLETRKHDLVDAVEELEAAVDDVESGEYGEVLDRHKEANELELEIDRLEDDLAGVEDDIEALEAELDREDDLKEERAAIDDRLEELRTRIDRVEAEAVEAFNEHMETVLDLLGYANLERIWIERTRGEAREGRRVVETSEFDLHVVRSGESGVYEDTVDHLSESEREVTGLVFALAGFLVHDVHEEVPFVVLDSLEAIDSERIADLVEYFSEFVDYVIVALLPEDAEALDDEYHYVTEI
jgi:DNA repair exonuclease SbcCD ATPase subunit